MLKEQVEKRRQDRVLSEKAQRWALDRMAREMREQRMQKLNMLKMKILSAEDKRTFQHYNK